MMAEINQALDEALGILETLTDPNGRPGLSSSNLYFQAVAAARKGRAALARLAARPRTPFIRSTCSGIVFDLANPTPEMVARGDIAWHLSMDNRWGGNLQLPYNVAHHSVLVARAMPVPQWRIYGLLHDAPEAYTGDLITPLKDMLIASGFDFRDIEDRILAAILAHFNLPPMTPQIAAAVHEADQLLLATEYRDVVRAQIPTWMPAATPLPGRIEPLDSDASYARFLSELDIHMREVA